MRYQTIRVEKSQTARGLTQITLARPSALNAISRLMHEELQQACATLRRDPTTRVVVLAADGRAFSAGHDLRDALPERPVSDFAERLQMEFGSRTSQALAELPQVTIAQIHGLTIGGGVVLVASLDLRVASTDAWFSLPETQLGLPLTWHALPRLMRELGPARTKELVMTGERFSAQQAERWGFVNYAVAPHALAGRVAALAASLLAKDELSIARTLATTRALAESLLTTSSSHADADYLMRPAPKPGPKD